MEKWLMEMELVKWINNIWIEKKEFTMVTFL